MKPLGIVLFHILEGRRGHNRSPGAEALEGGGIKTQKFLTEHETLQLQNKEALTCFKNPSCSCSCSQQLAASGISCSRALIQLSGQQERASGCPGSLRASTGKAPPCRPGAGCGASLHWVWKLFGVIFFFFFVGLA